MVVKSQPGWRGVRARAPPLLILLNERARARSRNDARDLRARVRRANKIAGVPRAHQIPFMI